jgi:hypothetical protein
LNRETTQPSEQLIGDLEQATGPVGFIVR